MNFFYNSTPVIIGVMVLFVVLGITFLIISPVEEKSNETATDQLSNIGIKGWGALITMVILGISIITVAQYRKEDDKHD